MATLDNFEPVFGEPTPEWSNSGSGLLRRFLFHVYAPDSSHLVVQVTDFHSISLESVRSISQLDDMRDSIGIGGSWSDFIDYVVDSIKSKNVKLVLEGNHDSKGATSAKLVAQKAKGMPRISISLKKVSESAVNETMANLSLGLFKAFTSLQDQERPSRLTKVNEKEDNESTQSELRKNKFRKVNSSDKPDISTSLISDVQDSTDKKTAKDVNTGKVINRVVPAYRRAKVRGARLQDSEDYKDT